MVSLQAMSMFSSALASGQLGPLMNQFGLPAEAVDAANKGGQCWLMLRRDAVPDCFSSAKLKGQQQHYVLSAVKCKKHLIMCSK